MEKRRMVVAVFVFLALCFSAAAAGTMDAKPGRPAGGPSVVSTSVKGNILVYSTITNIPSKFYTKDTFDDDLPAILMDYAYSVTVTDRIETPQITGSLLAGYDELWILSTRYVTTSTLNSDDLDAISDFRNQGKGLLIIADHGPYATDATEVSRPLGVTFSGNFYHGVTGTAVTPTVVSHPLFDGVTTVCGHHSSGGMNVTAPAQVVATYSGSKMIAVLDDGSGRVVFDVSFVRLLDDGTSGHPQLITVGDNPQYVRNIADWLMPPVTFSFDIHPRSCPNPFNINWFKNIDKGNGNGQRKHKKGGVMPAAIVGNEHFDVTDIDPTSLLLEGIQPERYSYEDVASPEVSGEECACNTDGPDGIMDLSLKFSRLQLACVLGEVDGGDVIPLTITGEMWDGTPFELSDCVKILSREPEDPFWQGTDQVVLYPAVPNPFNPVTRIRYALPEESFVKLTVYDVSGRVVEQLVSAKQSAGEYAIEWDAGNRPSGIYFSRLEVGDFVETKKLILLK